ncbi:MAG: deacylase [Acidobacteria bacterium 13_1_40CM_4_69_4]|nr:MAG: deacylase [Acidobacteria bacterium 13_1_40CM_4_69_4]
MPVKRLKEFLDGHHVKYVTVSHSRSYTAQDVAESAHVSGRELAKTVLVRLDGTMAMVVLPAATRVDFNLLKLAAGAKHAELAGEKEFKDLFPECELGAMPPFGTLYGMETYASDRLGEQKEIAFSAGSHTEIIRLSYGDFERLAKPKVLKITT